MQTEHNFIITQRLDHNNTCTRKVTVTAFGTCTGEPPRQTHILVFYKYSYTVNSMEQSLS